jgi:phytoene dehydrogenase-like protein
MWLSDKYDQTKAASCDWDVIVIGSGMGGLSCAATLARFGNKVLVVEQVSYWL